MGDGQNRDGAGAACESEASRVYHPADDQFERMYHAGLGRQFAQAEVIHEQAEVILRLRADAAAWRDVQAMYPGWEPQRVVREVARLRAQQTLRDAHGRTPTNTDADAGLCPCQCNLCRRGGHCGTTACGRAVKGVERTFQHGRFASAEKGGV